MIQTGACLRGMYTWDGSAEGVQARHPQGRQRRCPAAGSAHLSAAAAGRCPGGSTCLLGSCTPPELSGQSTPAKMALPHASVCQHSLDCSSATTLYQEQQAMQGHSRNKGRVGAACLVACIIQGQVWDWGRQERYEGYARQAPCPLRRRNKSRPAHLLSMHASPPRSLIDEVSLLYTTGRLPARQRALGHGLEQIPPGIPEQAPHKNTHEQEYGRLEHKPSAM